MKKPVAEIRDLSMCYGRGCPECMDSTGPVSGSNICPYCGSVIALNNISFDLYEGEILGIVGESGSGKSTIVKSLYFDMEPATGRFILYPYNSGKQNVFTEPQNRKRHVRNTMMGMVYQNPNLGLKGYFTSGGNIAEKLLTAGTRNYSAIRYRAQELLGRTEVDILFMDRLTRTLSGGMQQRVQIAKALANNPPLLLLDEVTTGLDVSVQARVLDLIKSIQNELGISMIVVSHDLGVIRLLTDRTLVLKNGWIVENGLTDQILEDPQHEYTQLLVHSTL